MQHGVGLQVECTCNDVIAKPQARHSRPQPAAFERPQAIKQVAAPWRRQSVVISRTGEARVLEFEQARERSFRSIIPDEANGSMIAHGALFMQRHALKVLRPESLAILNEFGPSLAEISGVDAPIPTRRGVCGGARQKAMCGESGEFEPGQNLLRQEFNIRCGDGSIPV